MTNYDLCDNILRECQGLSSFTLGTIKTMYPEYHNLAYNAMVTLKKDGYIIPTNLSYFKVSGEGIAFIAEGGYQEKNKKEKERERKKDQALDLSIEDLVDKVVESPRVKKRLQRAEIISITSVAIAAIAVMKGC